VIDAAGAIYVIGGTFDTKFISYQDVWASTDGGARPDSCMGGTTGGSTGDAQGYYKSARTYSGLLEGYSGELGVTQVYPRGTKGY
jgi:hypothetical protein